MSQSKIVSISTDNPSQCYTQKEILEIILKKSDLSGKERNYYKKFLSDTSIQKRTIALDNIDEIYNEHPDCAIRRFAREATRIGGGAILKCLQDRGMSSSDIDALIVTTCTGYLCPGLSSYILEALNFNNNIYAIDIVGGGCGAALPALQTAYNYLDAHPDKNVIVLSVEICSAAIDWGERIDLILSNALFGDGAAACLLSNKTEHGYHLVDYQSILWPEHRDRLRFSTHRSRLSNIISKEVPFIAAKAFKRIYDELKKNSSTKNIDRIALHPGGKRIIDAVEDVMRFDSQTLQASRMILSEYGNMSSPSVLYVLKESIRQSSPEAGANIALFSFGAGFSAYGLLIRNNN